MKPTAFPALVSAALLCALAQPVWANRYRIIDLGPGNIANGVNNAGSVSGSYYDRRALVYRHGGWQDLPTDGGASNTCGINDLGQVVGTESVGADRQVVVWQLGGGKRVLPLPEGGWMGTPAGISHTGFVAGNYELRSPYQHRCFRWTPLGRTKDLGAPGREGYCYAYDVNETGQVVGEWSQKFQGQTHAFVWQAGRMRDLGSLGGNISSARAINAIGEVVGYSETARSNEYHAFLWRNGRMTDIGGFSAEAINDRGDVVGFSYRNTWSAAVRFTQPGVVFLADEVENIEDWWLFSALSVNNKGEIIGIGSRSDGSHAFKLVPID